MKNKKVEEEVKENTMKNTKKNTGANLNISMHTEIISRRITQKINEIGRKTHALKKKQNAFYAEALEKSRHTEIIGKDKLREMTDDKFEHEWKEIEEEKDEVDWLIHRLYQSIEDEEKIINKI